MYFWHKEIRIFVSSRIFDERFKILKFIPIIPISDSDVVWQTLKKHRTTFWKWLKMLVILFFSTITPLMVSKGLGLTFIFLPYYKNKIETKNKPFEQNIA